MKEVVSAEELLGEKPHEVFDSYFIFSAFQEQERRRICS